MAKRNAGEKTEVPGVVADSDAAFLSAAGVDVKAIKKSWAACQNRLPQAKSALGDRLFDEMGVAQKVMQRARQAIAKVM